MNFNHYNIYSTLSYSNNRDNECFKQILAQADSLVDLDSVNQVKDFIKSAWGIENFSGTHLIAESCSLSFEESKSDFRVKLVCKNENIIYSYKKGV